VGVLQGLLPLPRPLLQPQPLLLLLRLSHLSQPQPQPALEEVGPLLAAEAEAVAQPHPRRGQAAPPGWVA